MTAEDRPADDGAPQSSRRDAPCCDAHGCDGCCCCCAGLEDREPSALGLALERLLGVTAAFCAVVLMIGGTIALLRWWL